VRLRFLLQPSWLALTVAVFAFAAACFTLLAPWQLGRHDERQATNDALQASLEAPPRPLAEVLPGGAAPDSRTQWSRVTITGEYLPEHELVARLRTVNGQPAYEILVPLRTDDGELVLIDRGYVEPGDDAQFAKFPPVPEGRVTVQARARIDEPPTRPAEPRGEQLHVYGVGSTVAERATGLDFRPGYFQLERNQPGALEPLPLPQLESGPFLSYGMQWIAFGVMALVGWGYFTWRELKPGGALHEAGQRPRRKTVAEMLAEDDEDTGERETTEAREGAEAAPGGEQPATRGHRASSGEAGASGADTTNATSR